MTPGATRESRQSAILEVLRSRPVQTQAQLAAELRRRRIPATQATISRDLRQLRVARVPGADGARYLAPAADGGTDRLAAALAAQLRSLEAVGQFVVLRTAAGGAMALAAAVDGLSLDQVAGSVAGDDTVFLLARSSAGARQAAALLKDSWERGRWA